MAVDRRQHPSVLQMVQQNDEKHEAAHTRLRLAHDRTDGRLDVVEGLYLKLENRLSVVEKARPEFDDLKFTTARVIMIVAAFLSVAGGMWASTYGLRSDVRDILTRGDAQSKLQEERSNSLRESIREMKGKIEMQQIQIGDIRATIDKQQAGAKR